MMDSLVKTLKNVTRRCEEKEKAINELEHKIQSMEQTQQVPKGVVQSRPATLLPVGSEDAGQTGKTTLQSLGHPAPTSHKSSSVRSEVGVEVSEMKVQFESQQTQLLHCKNKSVMVTPILGVKWLCENDTTFGVSNAGHPRSVS